MKIRTLFIVLSSLFIMNQTFTNPIETDKVVAKNGSEITIHFIQHASIYFTFEGLTIYTDPVNYEGIDYKKLPKADVIFVTHDHYDHLDKNAIADILKPNTVIFCNETVQTMLPAGLVLKNWDKTDYKSITSIEAVPAYNTTDDRDKFHPKGRDNGYIITLGDTRIYIPGDCEDMPEMIEFKDIDIAFLPVNQPYTMTVKQAINAAQIIKPKILYPIHYSDTDLSELEVLKKTGIDVRIFKM